MSAPAWAASHAARLLHRQIHEITTTTSPEQSSSHRLWLWLWRESELARAFLGFLLAYSGELWKRHPLNAKLVAASPDTGLWIVNDSSIRRLDPKNMEVLNLHEFDEPAEPVGLTLRQPD